MGGDNNSGYPMMCRNWLAIPHRQLYDDIHSGPGVDGTRPTQDTYARVGQVFAQTDADIQTGLAQLGVAYQGAGSDAAQSGITVLQQWTTDAQMGSELASAVVDWQASGYAYARDTMPEPVEVTAQDGFFDQVYDFFGGTTAREEQEAAAREAHTRAAQVMSEYDLQSGDAANAMPTFVPPPSVTVDVPAPQASTATIAGTNGTVQQGAGPGDPTGTNNPGANPVSPTPTVNPSPGLPTPGPTPGPNTPPVGQIPTVPNPGPAPTPPTSTVPVGSPAPPPSIPGVPPFPGTGPSTPGFPGGNPVPPFPGGGFPGGGYPGGTVPPGTGGSRPPGTIPGGGTGNPPGSVPRPPGIPGGPGTPGFPGGTVPGGGTGGTTPGTGGPRPGVGPGLGGYPPPVGGGVRPGGDLEHTRRPGLPTGSFGPGGFDPDGRPRGFGPGGGAGGYGGAGYGAAGGESFGPRGSNPGGFAAGGRGPGGFGPGGLPDEHAANRGGAAGVRGGGGVGAGGGFMHPAAPGSGNEDDREHRSKYVVETDKYFADDRLVPPPVIGENHPR